MPTWRRILVHHSATGPSVTAAQIRDFHVKERGWRDIGYHAVVLGYPHGFAVEPGRPLAMPGAHCPGQNSIALGVCMVGNFENAVPPPLQLAALAVHCADWCLRFEIPVSEIRAHREFRQTVCPGRVDMAQLRAQVEAILAEG